VIEIEKPPGWSGQFANLTLTRSDGCRERTVKGNLAIHCRDLVIETSRGDRTIARAFRPHRATAIAMEALSLACFDSELICVSRLTNRNRRHRLGFMPFHCTDGQQASRVSGLRGHTDRVQPRHRTTSCNPRNQAFHKLGGLCQEETKTKGMNLRKPSDVGCPLHRLTGNRASEILSPRPETSDLTASSLATTSKRLHRDRLGICDHVTVAN